MAEAVALAGGAYLATQIGPKFVTAGMSARTAQLHAHKMDDIRFRIERQKLYRQDIRDLMQTGRRSMDTYQKVGTLLVSFTLALFTGSQAYASMFNPNSKVPEWIVAMFSINNLCAIGYLTLSIWLAMHAAVISDSVGARLLTSFARLSIPSRQELEQIRTSVMPVPPVRSMFRYGARKIKKLRARRRASGESKDEIDDDEPQRQQTWPDLQEVLEKQDRRDKHHFHRFLKEQHNYIAYDEFSRVCMALGLNHLLATVSYYIIGVVWQRAVVAGAATLAAAQLLMLLVLRLDVADDFTEQVLSEEFWPLNLVQDYSRPNIVGDQAETLDRPLLGGVAAGDAPAGSATTVDRSPTAPALTTHVLVCILVVAPPLLGKLVWQMDLICAAGGLLCTLCFLMHAAWLFFIYKMIRIHKEDILPNYLRTVRYLNVLDGEQRSLAKKERDEALSQTVASLRCQRLQLQESIREILLLEEQSGLASSTLRTGEDLCRLYDLLQEEVNLAQLDNTAGFNGALSDELSFAEQLLEHCSVWQAAPGVWAGLLVLTSPLVRGHLEAEDLREATRLHTAFARRCRELELADVLVTRDATEADVDVAQPRRTRSATDFTEDALTPSNEGAQRARAMHSTSGTRGEFTFPRVFPADLELESIPRPIVLVRADDDGPGVDIQPLWIDGETGKASLLMPQSINDQDRVANPLQIISSAAQWLSLANSLQQSLWEHICESDRLHRLASSDAMQNSAVSEQTAAAAVASVPKRARAPGWLPRVIVQWFSGGLMLIWIFSAVAHLFRLQYTCAVAAPPEEELGSSKLSVRALHVNWPEPARLFEVISLHCNDEAVLVRSRFSTHVAERITSGLSAFAMIDTGTATGFCDMNGCGSLAILAHNSSLELVSDAVLPSFGLAEPKLTSWRLIAAAASHCLSAPCPTKLAAWDGTEVIISSAWQKATSGHWQIQPHFALRAPAGTRYTNITALQLGAAGQSLLVLSGQGELDSWDLVKGQLLGRWRLDRPARAMCQSGSELLFVREDSEGPVLESSHWHSSVAQPVTLVDRQVFRVAATS